MRRVLIPLLALVLLPVAGRPAAAQDVGELFRKVNPAVVVIRAKGRDVSAAAGGLVSFNETGSGVIVSPDGKVMTAAHVVHAMDQITVETIGGESVAAKVVASEPAADLSMLQLERMPKGAQVAKLADSDAVRVGDQVIVVGAPYGLGHSLSVGWISNRWAPNTVYKAMPMAEFFQTDASINTGNSGGPMFNMQGDVIGIVSHVISKSGGSEGLGFVVTTKTARTLLLEKRSVWSGLEGTNLRGRMADLLNLPQRSGYLIKTVARGSLGDALGLRGGVVPATIDGEQLVLGGDIILMVDDIVVGAPGAYGKIHDHMAGLSPGASFKMKILRIGEVKELTGRVP